MAEGRILAGSGASFALLQRQRAVFGVRYTANVAMQQTLLTAAAAVAGQQKQALLAFSDSLKKATARRSRMIRLHREVGQEAQQAVINEYQTKIGSRAHPVYRTGDRYAGGKLLSALGDPDFFFPARDGLLFINQALLDRKAKQWYRLNYGAGNRNHDPHPVYTGSFGGEATLSLRLPGGPGEAFRMPPGFFVSPGGEIVPPSKGRRGLDPFYLRGQVGGVFSLSGRGEPGGRSGSGLDRQAERLSGIRGRSYLDAGVGVIARELPNKYLQLAREWFDEARRGIPTAPPIKAGVRVGEAANFLRVLGGSA